MKDKAFLFKVTMIDIAGNPTGHDYAVVAGINEGEARKEVNDMIAVEELFYYGSENYVEISQVTEITIEQAIELHKLRILEAILYPNKE